MKRKGEKRIKINCKHSLSIKNAIKYKTQQNTYLSRVTNFSTHYLFHYFGSNELKIYYRYIHLRRHVGHSTVYRGNPLIGNERRLARV